MVIFAIGINDSQYIKNKNNPRVSIESFERNLNKLVDIVSENSPEIIFVGLTRVVEKKVMPIPWSPTKYYDNENIKKYNQIIQKVAEKNGVQFCPMYDLLNDDDLADGLHPNAEGHRKMFKRVREFLEKEIL